MKDIIEPTGISILSEGWSSSSASASSSSSSSDRASSTSRTDFDIVAVHGLFGQGFDSWTGGKEQIWLKDMLPRKLPDARIMAFAYDHNSTTRKSFSASSISEIALDLLDSLGSKRTTEKDQERPIIFIAHELGGIIVKQALLIAKDHSKHSSIEKNTCRLNFLGTPHRPASDAAWEDILLDIAIASPVQQRHQKSKFIKSITQIVSDISIKFNSLIGMYGILNVCEDEGSKSLPVISRHVATFGLSSERIISRPCSLFNLPKISNWDDDILESMTANSIHFNEEFRECRRTLWNLCPPLKLSEECSGSFEWLTTNALYQTWLDTEDSSILLLHGPQEFHASALSLFLLQCLGKPERWASSTVAYFAIDSGDCRKTSVYSLMVSLTMQILSGDPFIFNRVTDACKLLQEVPKWTKSKIWDLLKRLLTSKGRPQIICIINALHNCDASRGPFIRDLVTLISSADAGFKFVFISESIPEITNALSCFPEILIPKQLNHGMDPETQVHQMIEQRPALKIVKPELLNLSKQFCTSTDILWPTLTIEHLMFTKLRSTQSSICSHIQSLPKTSSQFLDKTLHEIPTWADDALSWILHAVRPLKLDELAVAISINDGTKTPTQASIEHDVPQDIARDLKDIFGPLVKFDDSEILLVHPSMKDILQTREKERGKTRRFSINKHWDITERCLAYLSMDAFKSLEFVTDSEQSKRNKSFAFLEYAVSYWPSHYRKSPKDDECRLQILEFLRNGPAMKTWVELNWRLGNPNTRQERSHSPILIASQHGLEDIVTALHTQNVDSEISVADRGKALKLAAENTHLDVVEILLQYPIDDLALVEVLQDASVRENDDVVELLAGHISETKRKLDIPPVCLCRAAETNNLNLAQKLQAAGADVDAKFNDMTPLHLASKYGHKTFVKYLLEQSVTLNLGDPNGATPLFMAVESGHTDIVSALTHAKADLNQPRADGFSPLHLAVETGQIETVTILLESKADPQAISTMYDSNPIHLACMNGFVEILELLIKADVDIEMRNGVGQTALMLASSRMHYEIVQKLIEHDAPLDDTDNNDETALYKAIYSGSHSITELLLNANACPNLERSLNSTPLTQAIQGRFPAELVKLLLEKGAVLESQDANGRSALHHAAITGDEAVLINLLERIPDLQAFDEGKQRTALHYASKFGNAAAVRILLEHGAQAAMQDEKQRTALHLAAKSGNEIVMQLLLAKEVDPDLMDKEKRTALHLASIKGNKSIILLLLDAGCNINAVDGEGVSALHLAIQSGHEDSVQLLLQKGANLSLSDEKGRGPLHYAAKNGQVAILESLLDKNSDIEAVDESGQTMLHLAAYWGRSDAIRFLLDKMANPNCIDNNHRTPIFEAVRDRRLELVQLLLDRGANFDLLEDGQWTPLHAACSGPSEDIVRLLLKFRHPTDIPDEDGWTPVHVAAMYGQDNILEALYDWNADLSAQAKDGRNALHFAFDEIKSTTWLLKHKVDVNSIENDKKTPLMLAVSRGLKQMVQLFVEHDANPNAVDNQGRNSLHLISDLDEDDEMKDIVRLLLNAKADVNKLDDKLQSIISKVIKGYSNDVLQLLLDAGASQENKNKALLIAVKEGFMDKVVTLLSAGADVNAKTEANAKNEKELSVLLLAINSIEEEIGIYLTENGADLSVDGPTALCMASNTNQEDLVQHLLDKNVDANARLSDNSTAFQEAIKSNSMTIIVALLKKGADLNLVGGKEGLPLHTAILHFPAAVQFLLTSGAKIDNVDRQGRFAIHHAAQVGRVSVLKLIQEAPGASMDVKDKQGRNILHHAAFRGSDSMVKFLLEKVSSIDINSADDDGWTALHWACKGPNPIVVQTLLDGGANSTKACKRNWLPRQVAIFHNLEDVVLVLDKAGPVPSLRQGQKVEAGLSSGSYYCDGCEVAIFGIRFHCKTCEDFDFCFKCHWTVEKTNPGHEFERIGTGPVEGPIYEPVNEE